VTALLIRYDLVNVFLPSMHGTKVSFMRDILSEAKLYLRQNEVNRMEVPCYQEISVKNLYEDAMKDELLARYLPTKEQLSGRLPEREFFFGLLCTLRNQYMKDIIAEAQKVRYTVPEDDPKNKAFSFQMLGWLNFRSIPITQVRFFSSHL
jgi:hypothetical protein